MHSLCPSVCQCNNGIADSVFYSSGKFYQQIGHIFSFYSYIRQKISSNP